MNNRPYTRGVHKGERIDQPGLLLARRSSTCGPGWSARPPGSVRCLLGSATTCRTSATPPTVVSGHEVCPSVHATPWSVPQVAPPSGPHPDAPRSGPTVGCRCPWQPRLHRALPRLIPRAIDGYGSARGSQRHPVPVRQPGVGCGSRLTHRRRAMRGEEKVGQMSWTASDS